MAAGTRDATGTVLGRGRFEVIRQLGHGGAGVVYEVRDRHEDARLALKTVRSQDPESLAALKREFRAAQDLVHPNLVRLDELFEEDGDWFFTMEVVEGTNWLAHVRDGGRGDAEIADEERIRSTLREIFEGLEALHAAGTLHRDIKPSNVFVTRDGHVKLLDFGVAFRARHVPTDEGVVGTLAYMSPEQLLAEPPAAAGDFYAVGVMLHQALTGELPRFDGAGDLTTRKISGSPSPVRRLAPRAPVDLSDLCDALLRSDASRRPTSAEVFATLGREPSSADQATSIEHIVGRAKELAALRSAFDAALSGEATTCIVHGPSGVGKSAIVRQFLHDLPRGTLVLEGRCHAREYVPYKALDAIVDDLTAFLSSPVYDERELAGFGEVDARLLPRLFPSLGRVPMFSRLPAPKLEAAAEGDGIELRIRVFEAFRELVSRVATHRMLVFAIDDVQWADADSLALLASLLAPPAPTMLVVCTRRLVEGESPAPLLVPGPQRHVAVGGLTDDDVATFVQHLAGDARLSEGTIRALRTESRGHPLFLQELVRRRAEGVQDATALRLDEVLWRRVSCLGDPERRLVEAVAVAGIPTAIGAVASAAGVERRELAPHLARLRGANLIKVVAGRDGQSAEPYHDRVREAVVASLGADARRTLHQRLARALDAMPGADVEVLFVHWREAGDATRAAIFAERAATMAERALAFEHAAQLFAEAIALHAAPDEGRRTLQRRRAEALANAGHGVEAARAYQASAAEGGEGLNVFEALDLRRRAAQHLLSAGLVDEGLAVAREVLAAFGMSLPRTPASAMLSLLFHRLRLWLCGLRFVERPEVTLPARQLMAIDLAASLALSLVIVDVVRGTDFQTRSLLLALDAGEPTRVAGALAAEASIGSMSGQASWAETEELLARAAELANRAGDPRARALAAMHAGAAAYAVGRYAMARARLDESLERLAECTGSWGEISRARYCLINTIADQGDIEELRRRVRLYLRDARDHGDLYGQTTLRTGQAVLVWLARDDPRGAHADIDEAMGRWSKSGFHVEHFDALVGHMEAHLYEADGPAAWERIVSAWGPLRRSLLLRVQVARVYSFYMRARAALAVAAHDSRARSARVAEAGRYARRCLREGTPFSRGAGLLLQASGASILGDTATAVPLFAQAVERFEDSGNALHAAACRYVVGALRGGAAGEEACFAEAGAIRRRGIEAPIRIVRMIAPGALPRTDD